MDCGEGAVFDVPAVVSVDVASDEGSNVDCVFVVAVLDVPRVVSVDVISAVDSYGV